MDGRPLRYVSRGAGTEVLDRRALDGGSPDGGAPRTGRPDGSTDVGDDGGDLLAMDPRMRQRRVEVQRQTSKRRLRLLGGALAAVTVVAAGLVVAHSPLLGVRHVVVVGAGRPAAAVLAEAGISPHEPLVDVSPAAAARRLEAVPDVATASVSRSWPGSLRIAVTLRRAVAQVREGASSTSPVAEIDATGRVVALSDSAPGLPDLVGVGRAGRPGTWLPGSPGPAADGRQGAPLGAELSAPASGTAAALGFLTQVRRTEAVVGLGRERGQVRRVTVGAGGAITALAGPGAVTLLLGGRAALAEKAAAVVAFLRAVPLAGLATVDFTVPNRPTASVVGAQAAGAGN